MPNICAEPNPLRKQFIPDADVEFAGMAERFAAAIARDPNRYMLLADDAAQLTQAAAAFREALTIANTIGQRTKFTIMNKDGARAMAERIVRKYGSVIRANPEIPTAEKMAIGISEKPSRLGKRTLPERAPVLTYHGPGVEATLGAEMHCTGTHILKFHTELGTGRWAKPPGAVRVEVFVDLVPPGEKLPKHPAQRTGRPWYLRSFTTNRMEVAFPMPSEPMLVVYWARWASSTGEVGPFSRPCIARQEGWTSTRPALPEGEAGDARRVETKYVFIQAPYQLPHAGMLEGDEQAEEIAAWGAGQRLLEAAAARMLDGA
jgi:hypothetical protein